MQQPKITSRMRKFAYRLENSPKVDRAIDKMDRCIGFMARGNYKTLNPAIAAVRTSLVSGLWVMLALTFVIVVWGILAPIESAANAHGSVMLFSSKKTIQHLEGGVIDEIFVNDGDRVTQGQKLIQLRDTAPDANRDSLQQQIYTEQATAARLIAERDNEDHISFDPAMEEKSGNDKDLADVLANQRHTFDSEKAEEDAKIEQLKLRISQSQEEMLGLQSRSDADTAQSDLLGKEIESVKALVTKGYSTETRLMALQRNQSELDGSKGQYEAQIDKSKQSMAETEMAIVNQQKDFETKTLQGLHESQIKLTELQDKLRAASDVQDRTVIKAPTEGIVTGLRFHTAGGVIAPGATIMEIVPQGDHLIIEAHIKPTDISSIAPGVDARIIFTSYKMRTTPKIPGKVTEISPDIINDEHSATPAPYYTARIEVDSAFLQRMKQPIELYPGMPVEVMIRTGSRSFLSYLLKPLTDSTLSAFREQ